MDPTGCWRWWDGSHWPLALVRWIPPAFGGSGAGGMDPTGCCWDEALVGSIPPAAGAGGMDSTGVGTVRLRAIR